MVEQTAYSTFLTAPFDEAVSRTRDAFAAQGFGILTEIDVTATLRSKVNAQIENVIILGACNPELAYRALESDRSVALMMPCNVVVRQERSEEGRVLVEALNPAMMATFSDSGALNTDLAYVAETAATLVAAAITALSDTA
ncbi:DUF302 domain-containing protein [Corynebacterium kalidii]